MTTLVIDVSRNSIRQSFSAGGIFGTVHHLLWFRIARPILVISVWALLGLYVGYSISSVGPSGLPFEQLRLYGDIIAGMGAVLVMWMILSRLDRAIRRRIARMQSGGALPGGVSREAQPADARSWWRPRNTRLLVVDHDDDGDITRVRSWQEWTGRAAPAGTATPPTPFTRSPEYDPAEPTLSAPQAIVVERADRAEPSLARPAPPILEPKVQTVTAEAAGFHRFGYRGKVGRTDWDAPAATGFDMRPGMSRHYGGVNAIVYGRPVLVATRRTANHLHAFGKHALLVDAYAERRPERIDPRYGFGRRANVVADAN